MSFRREYANLKNIYLNLKKTQDDYHAKYVENLDLQELKIYLLDHSELIDNLSIMTESYKTPISQSNYNHYTIYDYTNFNDPDYKTVTHLSLRIKFKGEKTVYKKICHSAEINDIGLYFLIKKYDQEINSYVSRKLSEEIQKFLNDQIKVNGDIFDETDNMEILLRLSKYDFILMFASKELRLHFDEEFLVKIIEINEQTIKYAPLKYLYDEDFLIKVILTNAKSINYMPDKFKNNIDFQILATRENGYVRLLYGMTIKNMKELEKLTMTHIAIRGEQSPSVKINKITSKLHKSIVNFTTTYGETYDVTFEIYYPTWNVVASKILKVLNTRKKTVFMHYNHKLIHPKQHNEKIMSLW